MPDTYRQAASLLLLRRQPDAPDGFEFLLLHKPRKNDAWQLPQGGKEPGEDTPTAALRELQEEAGITGVRVLGVSREVYQYTFPEGFRRSRPDNVCGQRIEYVLAIAEQPITVAVDQNEVNDFRWITRAELSRYVQRREYQVLVEKLYAEAVAAAV